MKLKRIKTWNFNEAFIDTFLTDPKSYNLTDECNHITIFFRNEFQKYVCLVHHTLAINIGAYQLMAV